MKISRVILLLFIILFSSEETASQEKSSLKDSIPLISSSVSPVNYEPGKVHFSGFEITTHIKQDRIISGPFKLPGLNLGQHFYANDCGLSIKIESDNGQYHWIKAGKWIFYQDTFTLKSIVEFRNAGFEPGIHHCKITYVIVDDPISVASRFTISSDTISIVVPNRSLITLIKHDIDLSYYDDWELIGSRDFRGKDARCFRYGEDDVCIKTFTTRPKGMFFYKSFHPDEAYFYYQIPVTGEASFNDSAYSTRLSLHFKSELMPNVIMDNFQILNDQKDPSPYAKKEITRGFIVSFTGHLSGPAPDYPVYMYVLPLDKRKDPLFSSYISPYRGNFNLDSSGNFIYTAYIDYRHLDTSIYAFALHLDLNSSGNKYNSQAHAVPLGVCVAPIKNLPEYFQPALQKVSVTIDGMPRRNGYGNTELRVSCGTPGDYTGIYKTIHVNDLPHTFVFYVHPGELVVVKIDYKCDEHYFSTSDTWMNETFADVPKASKKFHCSKIHDRGRWKGMKVTVTRT